MIAALCAAACIFIFVYLGWAWGLICVGACLAFFALTLTFKSLQEREERKKNPPEPKGDYITGRK